MDETSSTTKYFLEMKTNELMIKDWVRCDDVPCRIWMVDWQYNLVRCHHNGNEWTCGTEEIAPIELSEKILLDSGFEILHNSSISMKCFASNDKVDSFIYLTFYKKGDGKITLERLYLERDTKTTTINTISINFVHELQHILRSCGLNEIDDKIKVA